MLKYYGLFTVGISCLVIAYIPIILEVMLIIGGAENYLLAIPFILPNIIHTVLTEQLAGEADKILVMGNRPLFKSATDVMRTFTGLFFTLMYIFVLRWPQTYGLQAMIWLIPMGGFIPDVIRLYLNWWYIHKYICNVKAAFKAVWWQAFMAPLIPGAIMIATGYAWSGWVFPVLRDAFSGTVGFELGNIIAGVISVLFAFVFGLIFCFLMLYGFFGGWGDHSLSVFKEAVDNSGPSRIFFIPLYKMTKAMIKISPLHNKFPLDYKDAERERIELMVQREKAQELAKKESGS